ncbi:MAG: hypothetical protein Q9183_004325 [Haloplaca sp. 2 TL-2023]
MASTMTLKEEASSTLHPSTEAGAEVPDEAPSSTSPPSRPRPATPSVSAVCNAEVGDCGYVVPDIEKASFLMVEIQEDLGDETSMSATTADVSAANTDEDPRLLLHIGWIDGCDTFEEQDLMKPIEGNEDVTSSSILSELATLQCGGNELWLGGYTEVGCLRYDFYPTRMDPPDDDDETSFSEMYFAEELPSRYCGPTD